MTVEIVRESDVKIPMRDGALLDAMVWRPATAGRYPVLIERVAYELEWRAGENGERYARDGYVVVAQNVRGTYASEGQFDFWRSDGWGEHQDGYDAIEWAAGQPWSNGQVGMLDGSYSGTTQYLVTPTRPPHLRALFVRQGPANGHRVPHFPGGAHYLAFARDFVLNYMLARQLGRAPGIFADDDTRRRVEQASAEMERDLWRLPLTSWPAVQGLADWYWEILAHPDDGPYWSLTRLADHVSEIDTPILHLTSWYDLCLSDMLRTFVAIGAHGHSPACRAAQRLIVGPWTHGAPNVELRQVGELDFGPEAPFDLHGWRLRWYDHWLKGVENGVMDGPPVRVFLMGTNRWLGFQEWPPTEVTYRPLRLASSDRPGQGRLTFDAPPAGDPPDRYDYDPDAPVPSLIRTTEIAPIDYRSIEEEIDRVLVYTSEVLEQDLHVVGPLTMVLYASSSAPDTDWVVRLCDVYPDGRSMLVCDGILRARYRESFAEPRLLEPGQVYRFEVDLWATAQTFRAGHRLRLHVTSSDFPRYDRNLNTGGVFGQESRGRVATNTVFHDALRPSHLVLPVMAEADLSFVQM